MALTRLKILTPEGIFLEEDVEIVTLKTAAGEIGIQANRTPFVSYIQPSYIKIHSSNSTQYKECWVDGGIVHAEKNYVKVIVEKVFQHRSESSFAPLEEEENYKIEKSQFVGQEIKLKKHIKENSLN